MKRYRLIRSGMAVLAAGVMIAPAAQVCGCTGSPPRHTRAPAQAGAVPATAISDFSVRRMVQKASFETYVFSADPPWTTPGRIVDSYDPASLFQRMFLLAYRAEDGRHVVLIQSPSYNRMLKAKTSLPEARLLYKSPKGFKVWSGPKDKWLAGEILENAGVLARETPSEDRTGHLLETPAGTYPVLAINGKVTDQELRSLIDSLVPARAYNNK